jgi:hypothetical protein
MKKLSLAAALLLAPASGRAALASNGALTLRRALSARAAALGEALTGAGAGLDSLGVNPAGLAAARRPELQSTLTSGVIDDVFGFVGCAHPLKTGVAAAGLAYYDAGSVTLVDSGGGSRSVSAQRDYVAMAAWAATLPGGFSAGFLGKGYEFSLAQTARAAGFAGDAGARWETPLPGLSLGVSLKNMGPGVKFESESDPLPLTARAGAAWTYATKGDGPAGDYLQGTRLILTADASKVRDEPEAFATGGEFALDVGDAASVALRVSYVFNQAADGLAFGVGLREGRFLFDYAMVTKKDLGNVQDLTLGMRF